jgi:pre-mRNA-splicing factor CDC5/CEF1
VELEHIVKIGQAGENAKALVVGGSNASGKLLSDYEGLETARMARTQAQAAFTPNPLVTPRQQGSLGVSKGVSATTLRTPSTQETK